MSDFRLFHIMEGAEFETVVNLFESGLGLVRIEASESELQLFTFLLVVSSLD